jgi:hypothetical protein
MALIPSPIEVLGHASELHDQNIRQVFRLDLAALFAPEAYQSRFIVAQDDPSVGPTDEYAAVQVI